MPLLTNLADNSIKRSKSAQKIASYVLRDPQSVTGMPIAALAAAVGVSEPTVNRFCTGLGCRGFPDFKVQLAGELAARRPRVARNVDPEDSTAVIAHKIFDATHASLQAAEAGLDAASIDRAVALLDEARSITLCGAGASASVALDAQHKLLRFGIPVSAHSDELNQRVAATSLREGDCLVCISYTGRTRALLEVAQLATDAGASVMGITSPDAPLAEHCDLVLPVQTDEDTELYTPMSSRIAQLAIVDIVTTRLAVGRGEAFANHLRNVKQSLSPTRAPR